MRIDVVSIFPDYLRPSSSRCPARRGQRAARPTGARPARLDARPAPHRRRHSVRRWRRHGDEARAVGRGARRAGRPTRRPAPRSSCPRPAGEPFHQSVAADLATREHLVFACGRYEGIDQRVLDDAARPDGGPRGLARRLRAQRRRGGRARDGRGRGAAAARVHGQPRVARRGVPRRLRAARVPRLHQAADLARPRRPRRCCSPATTPGSRPGATTSPCGVRRSAAPTCCTPAHVRRRRWSSPPGCGPADAGELLTLQRACWVQEAQANPDVPIAALTESYDDVRAWLGEWTTSWSRTARAGWSAPCVAGSTATLWDIGRLMVAPDLQREGLGRLLLERIEAAAPAGRASASSCSPAPAACATSGCTRRRATGSAGERSPGVVRLTKRRADRLTISSRCAGLWQTLPLVQPRRRALRASGEPAAGSCHRGSLRTPAPRLAPHI